MLQQPSVLFKNRYSSSIIFVVCLNKVPASCFIDLKKVRSRYFSFIPAVHFGLRKTMARGQFQRESFEVRKRTHWMQPKENLMKKQDSLLKATLFLFLLS